MSELPRVNGYSEGIDKWEQLLLVEILFILKKKHDI